MDVAEQVKTWIDRGNTSQQRPVAVVDAVVEVEDPIWRTVRHKHIRVLRNSRVIPFLTVGQAVGREHRHAVETDAANRHSGVAEVMHIPVEAADFGAEKAVVVVSGDEDFVRMLQVAKPIEEVDGLLFRTAHREVARMHQHVSARQIPDPSMASVRIRYMYYPQR